MEHDSSFSYQEFAEATQTEGLLPITRRIAMRLNGKSFHNIPPFGVKENLGEWESLKNNIHLNGVLNSTIRSCVDRVLVEASKLEPSKLNAITPEQFAAVTSWAANWYRNRPEQSASLVNSLYNNDLPDPAELAECYTVAARSLVDFINGDVNIEKFIDEMREDDEILYFNNEDEAQSENNYDENAEHKDVGKRIFLIPFQDFAKFLDRDASTFDVMSKLIDQIPSLAINMEANKVKDEEGEEIDFAPLDINRLMKMSSDGFAALANPERSYFPLAIENKDLRMKEWYKITEQKRVELIMLDASGSMGQNNRAVRAMGYMMNRLDKVIEGKAIIAVCTFSNEVHQLTLDDGSWVIDTPEKAKAAKIQFYKSYVNHPGGSTNIPGAIRDGYKYTRMLTENVNMETADSLAHMTVITDDDTSSMLVPKTKDFIVNCLATADNDGMRQLCMETGGKYLPLSSVRVPVIK